MKRAIKRTAAAALAGIMAAGMLSGCGTAKELDGTKVVATVNETEIPMGLLSFYARQQQAQMNAMYLSFMGSNANIWGQIMDEETGETYGEQTVKECLEQIELMYILKEKAADYGVEVTEEDEKAMSDAAAAFMAANSEETIKDLAVTEEQIKEFLELHTYRTRIYDPIVADANVEVTDDEANQSAFSYVSISTSSDELTEEDIEKRKTDAQAILDKVKADPAADMKETAKSVDETYTALSGTFTTVKGEETEDSYPEEVMEVLRSLKEGEVSTELIETETGFYIVRLDKALDEEATESKRNSLIESRENEFYAETTDKWLEEAAVKVDEKVLETLTIDDYHTFSMKMPEPEEEEVTAETDEAADAELEEEPADDAADDTVELGEEAAEEDAAADDAAADTTEE